MTITDAGLSDTMRVRDWLADQSFETISIWNGCLKEIWGDKMKKNMSTQSLVEQDIEAGKIMAEALPNGEYKKNNREAKKIKKLKPII